MKTIYKGKTKDVLEENGKFYLKFKDDMTGTDGVFDTGGNEVAGSIEGAGHECLKVSKYLFEKIEDAGIKSHYISSDLDKNIMEVEKALPFGKGLEVITRFKAVGSFYRRYELYVEEGQDLPLYTEITLKDDAHDDPLITKEGLVALNILTVEEYDEIIRLNKEISKIVKNVLAEHGLELYDIKLEYGKIESSNEIVLIDEVSGGNMRAYKDGKYIEPLEVSKYLGI